MIRQPSTGIGPVSATNATIAASAMHTLSWWNALIFGLAVGVPALFPVLTIYEGRTLNRGPMISFTFPSDAARHSSRCMGASIDPRQHSTPPHRGNKWSQFDRWASAWFSLDRNTVAFHGPSRVSWTKLKRLDRKTYPGNGVGPMGTGLLIWRIFLGGVLIWAGLAKSLSPRWQLKRSLAEYVLIPKSFVSLVGTSLPVLELVLGVSLVVGLLLPLPMVFAAVLFAVFAVAMMGNLLAGRRTPCACFGPIGHRISWTRASAAIAIAMVTLVGSGVFGSLAWRHPFALAPDGHELTLGQVAVALALVVLGAGLVLVISALRLLALGSTTTDEADPKPGIRVVDPGRPKEVEAR